MKAILFFAVCGIDIDKLSPFVSYSFDAAWILNRGVVSFKSRRFRRCRPSVAKALEQRVGGCDSGAGGRKRLNRCDPNVTVRSLHIPSSRGRIAAEEDAWHGVVVI